MSMLSDYLSKRSKINNETGCIEWALGLDKDGYGKAQIKRKTLRPHRIAWEEENGEIADGYYVCHKCDNRKCINVDHLFLGSHKDNMEDMKYKGRGHAGEKNHMSILSESQIKEIREMGNGSYKRPYQKEIAEMFGISRGHVSKILTADCWQEAI